MSGPGHSLVPPWADFNAGRWTADYFDAPCDDGRDAAARAFPGWATGAARPAWDALVEAALASGQDGWRWACWLVARVLVRDRALLVEWVRAATFIRIDATEHLVPVESDEVRAVRGELLAWCAGADVDLVALRAESWSIRISIYATAARVTAARAATTAAHLAAAAAAAGTVRAIAERAILTAALPLLDRAVSL